MPKLDVPDAALEEVQAIIEATKQRETKLARIAEIEEQIAPLQAERAALLQEVEGRASTPVRLRRSSNGISEEDVLSAIRGGAETNTQIAEQLGVSVPTVAGRVKVLLSDKKVKAEGKQRGRKLRLA